MGNDIHWLCHKVIVIEQAANKATEDNATMRLRRLGRRVILVWGFFGLGLGVLYTMTRRPHSVACGIHDHPSTN